jgi:hypothetical protein
MTDKKVSLGKDYKGYTGETPESAAKLFEDSMGYAPQETFETIGNIILCGPVKNEQH